MQAPLCLPLCFVLLCRQLLLALISKQEELLRVGTVLNARFMQPDVAVAADEFILITAAMRYGFVKQVVQRKLQTHMAAVRRQHRQQAPATAGQPHQLGEACEEERPTKQQRSRSQKPHGAVRIPVAGSQHAGSRRSSASTAAGSSGSRPGSRSSSRDSSTTRVGACVAAVAGPLMDDSSGGSSAQQQGSRGRRVRREQGDGAAGVPPEELVGRSIKVWWELDQAFYRGNVTVSGARGEVEVGLQDPLCQLNSEYTPFAGSCRPAVACNGCRCGCTWSVAVRCTRARIQALAPTHCLLRMTAVP